MASNKTYWKNLDQLDSNNVDLKKLEENEFVSKLPEDFLSDEKALEESITSRRDFLKYVGSVSYTHLTLPTILLV